MFNAIYGILPSKQFFKEHQKEIIGFSISFVAGAIFATQYARIQNFIYSNCVDSAIIKEPLKLKISYSELPVFFGSTYSLESMLFSTKANNAQKYHNTDTPKEEKKQLKTKIPERYQGNDYKDKLEEDRKLLEPETYFKSLFSLNEYGSLRLEDFNTNMKSKIVMMVLQNSPLLFKKPLLGLQVISYTLFLILPHEILKYTTSTLFKTYGVIGFYFGFTLVQFTPFVK